MYNAMYIVEAAMRRMKRKQIYLEPEQDRRLRVLSRRQASDGERTDPRGS